MTLVQMRRHIMLRMKRVLLVTALLVCLTALPVLAQDAASATAPADTSGPTGITTLVILFGLGAMFAVGGMIYMKEHSKNGKEVD
jgi:hypothetical protein